MTTSSHILILGAGVYGVTTALALRARGHAVTVLDPGPLPHPLAASTDISKVIRMEYGADQLYMEMGEAAVDGWHDWNDLFGAPLYHEVGVTMLTSRPMQPGEYQYESYRLLLERGHRPERLDAAAIAQRFPAWNAGRYVDGFFHARGGYAESGRVVEALVALAQQRGVVVRTGDAALRLVEAGGRVVGVQTRGGEELAADHVVAALGAWTGAWLPELAELLTATGHPVFHLRPADPTWFEPPRFAVFTADIATSGWYGFPLHPTAGVVKIANHGVGVRLHPERDARVVTEEDIAALRAFLAATFPSLHAAPIVYTRRCLYCDTPDGHFLIDRHPQRPGLTVAAGGSGHAFKFAPILGDLIADAVEGRPNAWASRFTWRDPAPDMVGQEAARFYGADST